jgi:hypothetical protein
MSEIKFPPDDSVMPDVLAALGGNVSHWKVLTKQDMNDGGDRALEYALTYFGPFATEFPEALQMAIDEAARLRHADREYLMSIVQMGDVPAYLRNPNWIQSLTDDGLRLAAISLAFRAAMDLAGEGKSELIIVRWLPDGTRKMQQIGIRNTVSFG